MMKWWCWKLNMLHQPLWRSTFMLTSWLKKLFTMCPSMVIYGKRFVWCWHVTHFLWVLQLLDWCNSMLDEVILEETKTIFLSLKCTNRVTVDENKIASKPPGHNSRSKRIWPGLTWHRSLALHLWLNLEYYKLRAAYLHKCKLNSQAKLKTHRRSSRNAFTVWYQSIQCSKFLQVKTFSEKTFINCFVPSLVLTLILPYYELHKSGPK